MQPVPDAKPALPGQGFLQHHFHRFLKFSAADVPEKKKGAVGVRGIRLQKNDEMEHVYLYEDGIETKIQYNEKEVTLNRLKLAKRDGVGTKYRG